MISQTPVIFRCSLRLALPVFLGVALQGCAAVGLAVVGSGAGVAVGTATGYTLDGIAYRTFTAPLERVQRATLTCFRRMEIALSNNETTTDGRKIVGLAGDREVNIELERLTAKTTRLRVTAKHGIFLRDRATAGEIIAQVEHALDEMPPVSRSNR